MGIKKRTPDHREKALQEAVKNTPRQYSANELCGFDDDNEDVLIYERRCLERDSD
jgi:hypothetical protein